jgi:hypothetical protein
MLLYFGWYGLVVLVVFQVDLVGNDNQPDGVIYVSCRCRPFLLNHCALLILTIVHFCYKIMLLYFNWYQLVVAPDVSQVDLVGNVNQPELLTLLLHHSTKLTITICLILL